MTDLSSLVEDGKLDEPATTAPEGTSAQVGSLGGVAVQRVSEMDLNFNMLIYGKAGVGKTVLAGSSADVDDMGPVLFIDVEGGTLSVDAMGYDVDVARVLSWQDMQRVYEQIYDGRTPYKTVVLDSLTEIQKFSMGNIMYQVIQEDSNRDPDIPSLREWGKNIEQTRRLVRGFRDLPINTIFTALVIEEKNNKTGAIERRPQLSGKLSGEVAGFLDIVVFMYRKVVDDEQVRLLLTQGTDDTVAKDRSNALPPVIQNPTMQDLYPIITGK